MAAEQEEEGKRMVEQKEAELREEMRKAMEASNTEQTQMPDQTKD